MNTAGLVTEIGLLVPNWSRSRILGLLNNLLQMAYKAPLKSQLYVSPSTGDFPYLSTTAGIYVYSVNVASVWSVSEIVVDGEAGHRTSPLFPGLGLAVGLDTSTTADGYVRTFNYNQKNYTTVPCIKVNAVGSTKPTVTFQFDPGTNATLYRIAGYNAPTQVLSESVEYPVDDCFRYTVVIPAVQLLIDGFDNGRYVENMMVIEEKLIPKLTYSAEVHSQNILATNYSY